MLWLALPDPAWAWRHPTSRERSAIGRTAVATQGSRLETVDVSDIRISTVGPWATAVLTISRRGSSRVEQTALDTFYKAHSGWIDTVSVKAPDREFPLADQRDLGYPGSSTYGGVYLRVYFLIAWFFGLAGVVDVLLQPRRAFRAAGHSKLRWLLIELVGAAPAGLFTWAIYAIKIRPDVVGAGGRPPRKLLRALFKASAASAESRASGDPRPSPYSFQSEWSGSKPPTKCGSCVNGRIGCSVCRNTGHVPNHNDPTGNNVPCNRCHGEAGGVKCFNCAGTGLIS